MVRRVWGFAAAVALLLIAGCGERAGSPEGAPGGAALPALPPQPSRSDVPAVPPLDALQPWEVLNGGGFAEPGAGRATSAVAAGGVLQAGIERFREGGYFADNGEATTLSGSAEAGWAMYRLPLAGAEPGLVTVDANVYAGSEYYVALGDYAANAWDWHGPYVRNCVRLSTAGGDFTSPVGSLFVLVAVPGGSSCDVIAVGAHPADPYDDVAPPAPQGLVLTPLSGGLLAEWEAVAAEDLAGYRVLGCSQWFIDARGTGVRLEHELEGITSCVIPGPPAERFVRIVAVDTAGNESDPGPVGAAIPLPGPPAELRAAVARPGGWINQSVVVSADGADACRFDLDGDGLFEGSQNATGTEQLAPAAAGVWRVNVRGLDASGGVAAQAGVSYLAIDNARPVVTAAAQPPVGPIPLDVSLTGYAVDQEDPAEGLVRAWDLDGDGLYEPDTDVSEIVKRFPFSGTVVVRFRATDTGGAAGVARVPVVVTGPQNDAPVAVIDGSETLGDDPLEIRFDASASHDPDGYLTDFEWDFDGDGVFSEPGDEADSRGDDRSPVLSYTAGPPFDVAVRVMDNFGATATARFEVAVHGWVTTTIDPVPYVGHAISLMVVNGRPAVGYTKIVSPDVGDLWFVQAADFDGLSWNEPMVLDAVAAVSSVSMVMVNHKPAIAYNDRHVNWGKLLFIRSADVYGDVWRTPVEVTRSGTPEMASLAIVNGNPAIAYHDFSHRDPCYVRALDEDGTDWTEPVRFDPQMAAGQAISLAVVNGHPAVCYYNQNYLSVDYARALDPDGIDWENPSSADPSASATRLTLLVLDGFPAISHNGRYEIFITRAFNPNGAYEWNTSLAAVSGEEFIGDACLCLIDGLPAISYFNESNKQLWYVRSADAAGTMWGEPELVDADGWVGYDPSLIDLHGYPAIAYRDYDNQSLKFARMW